MALFLKSSIHVRFYIRIYSPGNYENYLVSRYNIFYADKTIDRVILNAFKSILIVSVTIVRDDILMSSGEFFDIRASRAI